MEWTQIISYNIIGLAFLTNWYYYKKQNKILIDLEETIEIDFRRHYKKINDNENVLNDLRRNFLKVNETRAVVEMDLRSEIQSLNDENAARSIELDKIKSDLAELKRKANLPMAVKEGIQKTLLHSDKPKRGRGRPPKHDS